MMAFSLPVGFCWYCASHLETGSSAFSASKSSIFQNPGHRDLPEGKIAGNSITSQSLVPSFSLFLRICPVKSRLDQRVITITMAPPGCRRCLGPDVYHSYTPSKTAGLPCLASCSEWGSSITRRSAPLPVTAPPTPIAK